MGAKKLIEDIDSVMGVIRGLIIDMENDLSRKVQPVSNFLIFLNIFEIFCSILFCLLVIL